MKALLAIWLALAAFLAISSVVRNDAFDAALWGALAGLLLARLALEGRQ